MSATNPQESQSGGSLERVVGQHVVHKHESPRGMVGGHWVYETELRDVILMALSGKWAMVRRPGCIPYVTASDELVLANS